MRVAGAQNLTHHARLVFETLRDRTPELAAIMPNVEGVDVLGREEVPPLVKLESRWQGAQHNIPALMRPFVRRELLAWLDHAVWNEETLGRFIRAPSTLLPGTAMAAVGVAAEADRAAVIAFLRARTAPAAAPPSGTQQDAASQRE